MEESKKNARKILTHFSRHGGCLSKLVFSYDSLPNSVVKKCFEYCSLYPKDHNISEEGVIKLWLAEGFIGEYDNMYDALIQGRQIMESLKQACLLETGERTSTRYSLEEETVKMHDVIRDMALWIACEREKKRNKFCVEVANGDHNGISIAPNAEKIYLEGTGITTESLGWMSFCPNLTTLIIQNTNVEELPRKIAYSMKVLDLLNNMDLTRLPIEDGCLTNLEYLNIRWTGLEILPVEVSQWKKLRFLTVDSRLKIPKGIISSLCSLQMFEQQVGIGMDSMREHYIKSERDSMEIELLSELEGLKHTMDIRLSLHSATVIQILLNSPKLQKCTTRLYVHKVESIPDIAELRNHLERLLVEHCKMSEMKLGRPSLNNNLREVYFFDCGEIQNLSSLIYVPNLSILYMRWCNSMSELVGEESSNVGFSLFSSLTSLTLIELPKLRSICPLSALPFPSLKSVTVYKCKRLRKLPLDSNSVSTIPQQFIIKGNTEWWDKLEWDSQATKDAFALKFISPTY